MSPLIPEVGKYGGLAVPKLDDGLNNSELAYKAYLSAEGGMAKPC